MNHPERLGKYPITSVIGEGAMGVVYRGYDPVILRPVALKAIRRELLNGDDQGSSVAARFRNEAQAAGRMVHPGIVAVYDYGEDDTGAFIAMEYVEGHSLAHYLAKGVKFPDADVMSIMVQLLDALHYAHEKGVWHRDIKPANLMITGAGRLKVADFGIARIESAGQAEFTSVVGTPSFMAPEQFSGVTLDRRVDIFSCGVLMYLLLTDKLPFGGSLEKMMYAIMTANPAPPSQTMATPRAIDYDALIAKALAKAADDRFSTAAEFKAAMLALATSPVSEVLSLQSVTAVPASAALPAMPAPSARSAGTSSAQSALSGGTTRFASPSSGMGSGTPGTGWDIEVLKPLETALAHHLGPVAKVLINRLSKQSNDLASLKTALAEQIPELQARTEFMARTDTLVSRSMQPTMALSREAPGTAPTHGGQPGISAELAEQARKLMAVHIGPIAKIVVKQASDKAQSRNHFFELLAAQVSDSKQRAQLAQDLSRLP